MMVSPPFSNQVTPLVTTLVFSPPNANAWSPRRPRVGVDRRKVDHVLTLNEVNDVSGAVTVLSDTAVKSEPIRTHPPVSVSASTPPISGLRGAAVLPAALARAILADLRKQDRPGMRVIAATHGVSVNTVQRIAHAR
jgi:hypothetical protein